MKEAEMMICPKAKECVFPEMKCNHDKPHSMIRADAIYDAKGVPKEPVI